MKTILEQLKNIQELAIRMAQDAEGIQRQTTSAILNWDAENQGDETPATVDAVVGVGDEKEHES